MNRLVCPSCGVADGWDGTRCTACGYQQRGQLKLSIRTEHKVVVLEAVSPDTTVWELIAHVLRTLGLPTEPGAWRLIYQGSSLTSESLLSSCLPATREIIELVFEQDIDELSVARHEGAAYLEEDAPPALGEEAGDEESDDAASPSRRSISASVNRPGSTMAFLWRGEEAEVELNDLLCAEEMAPVPQVQVATGKPAPAAAPQSEPRRSVTRRATVRHYQRMNPERVYPLLVLISVRRKKGIFALCHQPGGLVTCR